MHQFQKWYFELKDLFRGLRFGVQGSGFEAASLKFKIWVLEFGGFGLWVKVRVGLWSWGLGFLVWGLSFGNYDIS